MRWLQALKVIANCSEFLLFQADLILATTAILKTLF